MVFVFGSALMGSGSQTTNVIFFAFSVTVSRIDGYCHELVVS